MSKINFFPNFLLKFSYNTQKSPINPLNPIFYIKIIFFKLKMENNLFNLEQSIILKDSKNNDFEEEIDLNESFLSPINTIPSETEKSLERLSTTQ